METILAILVTLLGLFCGMFVIWRKPGSSLSDPQENSESP